MDYILNSLECFADYEGAYLKVTNNSNLYYIKNNKKTYVAWENIDSTTTYDNNQVEYEKSYYDVITGDMVLHLSEYKCIDDNLESNSEYVQLLSKILRLKENEERFYDSNDIKAITSFEEKQIVKIKTLKEGKHIF